MSDEWSQALSPYIEMARDVRPLVCKILSRDEDCGLFSRAERAALETRYLELGELLHKMEARTFEVAVVGLENSGKSTLANALLGIPVLPSASVRCTYTTTEIRAGDADSAEVEFYTQQEFQERFSRMLQELDMQDTAKNRFQKLTLAAFNAHWEQVAQRDPGRHRLHDATTAEDVRAILRATALISDYLDRPPMRFLGASQLTGVEFQSFITGAYDETDALLRDERPFAVKKVTIYSSGLQYMRNMLLYDVPGFNSPTLVHKEQTRRMMDKADAIVMVADILANPNIDGTQLSMLKEMDGDHVLIKDKLFVFGNKADLITDKRVYKDNCQTFFSDIIKKHRLTGERRVIAGSARAYFDTQGGDDTGSERLRALGADDGIERLRAELLEYYQQERMNVLAARASRCGKALMDALRAASERYQRDDADAIQIREFSLVIQAKDETTAFRKGARDIISGMYRDISRRKPFTGLLCRRISERIQPIGASDSLYQEILGSLNVQGDGANRNELVNANVRMNLQGYFNSLIERMVWDIAQGEEKQLLDELTEELLRCLGFTREDSPFAEELQKSAHTLVMRMFDAEDDLLVLGQETPFRARGFIALITRFVPGLTSAIVGYPLGSQGRVEEVIRLADELIRLFDAKNGRESDVDGVACLAKILTHQDYFPLLKNRNRQALERFMRRHRNIREALDEARVEAFIQRWSSLATQYDVDLTGRLAAHTTLSREARKIGKKQEDDGRGAYSQLSDLFADALGAFMKTRTRPVAQELFGQQPTSAEEGHLPGRGRVVSELIAGMAARARVARTEQEILDEINQDVTLYAQVLSELLVPHLNLEKAFYERFINQINAMTGHSAVYDHKADALINDWLIHNIKRIKCAEFDELTLERGAHECRRQICELIAVVLAEWEERYDRL